MNSLTLIRRHSGRLVPLAASMVWPPNTAVVLRHAVSLLKGQAWHEYRRRLGTEGSLDGFLARSLDWLAYSQDKIGSGGVGCYEFYRWTTGYPEVTGYIIPTFWDAARALDRSDLADRAIRMADWELRVQRPSGGFEGCYEGDGKPETVFNTGQVIRGLHRTYEETKERRFLDGALRAAEWTASVQEPDGSWAAHNFKGMRRVYDTYVAAPMIRLGLSEGRPDLVAAGIRNCDFALQHQQPNGWFDLADNTPEFTEAPVTHTIAYTIDGLLESSTLLSRSDYFEAARRTADALMHAAETRPPLPARFDRHWKPTVAFSCLTGCAQTGIVLSDLYEKTADARYLNAALKLTDFLAYVIDTSSIGRARRGGMPGSYPIWGMYCPFKYPAWAAKYFVDLALRLQKHIVT